MDPSQNIPGQPTDPNVPQPQNTTDGQYPPQQPIPQPILGNPPVVKPVEIGMLPQQQAPKKDVKPTISLIAGILGYLTAHTLIGLVFGLVAVILGFLSFKNGKTKRAIAGIILGILLILVTLLLFWIIHDSTAGKIAHSTSKQGKVAQSENTPAGQTLTTECFTIKDLPSAYFSKGSCTGYINIGNSIQVFIKPESVGYSSSLSDMLTKSPITRGTNYLSKTPITIDNIAAIQTVAQGSLTYTPGNSKTYQTVTSPILYDFVYTNKTYSNIKTYNFVDGNVGIDGFVIQFNANNAGPTLQEEQSASAQLLANWQWK